MDLDKKDYWVAFHGVNHLGEDGFLTGGNLSRQSGYTGSPRSRQNYARTVTRVYVQDFDDVENMLFSNLIFVLEWDYDESS